MASMAAPCLWVPASRWRARNLTVLVAGGDGDGFSIGGNHFLHACRRNIDITYIVMDNQVYGMTKGQPSPTTAPDWDSALSPGGTGVRPFHPLVIALASGANFVARAFSGDIKGTTETLVEAVRHPGFSFVEVLSPCVTFRPEQREWKSAVHAAPVDPTTDPARAARRIMTDDGFNIGVLYRGTRDAYSLSRSESGDGVAQFEEAFASMTARSDEAAFGIANEAELLAHAHAIEQDAVERYRMLADQMETHNNPGWRSCFAELAGHEEKHAAEILAQAGDIELPDSNRAISNGRAATARKPPTWTRPTTR